MGFTPLRAPQVVCEQLGRAVCEEQITADMMEQKAVVSELFSSVCVEIRDEVGSARFKSKGKTNIFYVVVEPTQKGVSHSTTGEHSTQVSQTAGPNGRRLESHECWKAQC